MGQAFRLGPARDAAAGAEALEAARLAAADRTIGGEADVPDLNVRLALYRRLSDAERADDREALAAELIDRFGPLPPEADQLLKVVAIKGLCREANVAKIDVGPKGAVVSFRADHFANPAALVGFIQKNAIAWRLRPDQKVVIKGEWETPVARLGAAERILGELAKLARG